MSNLDLTDARALFVDALMPDTCAITTVASVSDSGGASTPGTPTAATSVCRLWQRSGRQEEQARIVERGQYGLALPVDVSVSPSATVTVSGRTFRIVWQPPVVGLSLEQELGLEEVR